MSRRELTGPAYPGFPPGELAPDVSEARILPGLSGSVLEAACFSALPRPGCYSSDTIWINICDCVFFFN